ncbi:unnamed protein product, partial [Allacma fusca]
MIQMIPNAYLSTKCSGLNESSGEVRESSLQNPNNSHEDQRIDNIKIAACANIQAIFCVGPDATVREMDIQIKLAMDYLLHEVKQPHFGVTKIFRSSRLPPGKRHGIVNDIINKRFSQFYCQSQAGVNDNAMMGKDGIVILLSILIVCIPSAFSGLISPVVKRQLSSPYEVLVAEAATKLPNERFESDPILLQVVENSQSFYRNLENLESVFHRQQDDFGKEVIVLSESEDHVFRAADDIKRVFVVLRRKQGNLYHVAYAYIRKVASSNEPTESNPTGNDFIRIEWDSWS